MQRTPELYFFSPKRTFGWCYEGPLNIITVCKGLDDAEWRAGMQEAMAVSKGLDLRLNLSFAPDVTLSQTQRREAADILAAHDIKPADYVALVTDNRLVVGAATAFSWMTKNMKLRAFTPKSIDKALDWLHTCKPFDREAAAGKLAFLNARMAVPSI